MKTIGRYPIEIFCYRWDDNSDLSRLARRQQYCRYIHGTCVKPRKSEPEIKIGICSVGAAVNGSKQLHPVIICPQRFKTEAMFEALREKYLASWENVKWIQEVNLGVGGNVDYVAVEVDKYDRIKDFLCVEIQAAGTTGTPYPYVKELLEEGHYSGKKYTYGINWANEFSKTMMQQAYKKGKIVELWNRKIVFVVQNVAMDYIKTVSDCTKLVEFNPIYPVDFCTFNFSISKDEAVLSVDKIFSTTMEGINLMLGGAVPENYLSEEEFIKNIAKKGLNDGVLCMNNHLKKFLEE
ncbi:MAG: hypothetical protein K2M71_04430 [Duncaniella sp.]|nr:hypothetical protein [Duncaniella sp.]